MSNLKFKKHKQSKFFTIMLVPYSSKKTASLRIPHWVFHLIFIFISALVITIFIVNSRTNYFRLQADSISNDLNEVRIENSLLEEAKAEVESNVEAQKNNNQKQKQTYEEQIARERAEYEKELEYYEEKARELELKLEELDNVKDEIYDLLSQKAGYEVAHSVSAFSGAGSSGDITFMNYFEEEADYAADPLNLTYISLEEHLLDSEADYENLVAQAKKIKPYLDAKPTIWPVWGRVTSEMGKRPNPFGGTGTESHSGIDIAVATGTSVKATGSGKVVQAGWSSGYGYLVTIDHGYGIKTMYGHNSKVLVSVGDWVSRGDIIAKSGSTGRSTGPHVHYEVRVNDVITNPRNYLN